MISVKFVYNDGKDLNVNIPDEDFSKFFLNLNENKPYWDKDIKNGFWTNMSDVRFIQFQVLEDANEPKQEATCEGTCDSAQCESVGSGEAACGTESIDCSAE